MVPDVQADSPADLVDLDPQGAIDVQLFWQQWRLRSAALERVAAAVSAHAELALQPPTRQRAGRAQLRRG
jgi:LysR family transcriptional regulator (chromosome initiation inhibitor)